MNTSTTPSEKPDCCQRAEAVGGDCPHSEDPDFFGPGDHDGRPTDGIPTAIVYPGHRWHLED